MGKDKEESLFRDLMEYVWNPHTHDYKYFEYLEGERYE